MVIRISDRGRGIPNLLEIMEGRYQSRTGMGLGIVGARRLMDQFQVESAPGAGTTVLLKKLLPATAGLVSNECLRFRRNSHGCGPRIPWEKFSSKTRNYFAHWMSCGSARRICRA